MLSFFGRYLLLCLYLWLPLEASQISPFGLEQLREHIHYRSSNTIGYIAIDQREVEISQATWLYVQKALEYYRQSKPLFIIVKLNTPGGQVFPAQQIADALRQMDTKYHIPVVAYIDDWAISAGALIAYGCRFIAVADNGSMGAAEPIMQLSTGETQPASEKINSALRVDFANRARLFRRPPAIAEAMVDKDMIVVWRGGQAVRLDSSDQIQLTGPEADEVISAKGKLLTLNAAEMLKYGVADVIVPAVGSSVTADEYEAGRWPATQMALWQAPFFRDIPHATVDAYRMDWKTRFFVFLTTPAVSSLLFTVMIVAFYLEMNHPGVTLPGVIAALCLALIIMASFALEIARWLEVILLIAGLLLVATELLILPTGGLLALLGAFVFCAGFVGLLLPNVGQVDFDWQSGDFNGAGEMLLERLGWLGGALVAAAIVIMLLMRYIQPRWYRRSRLILTGHEQDASAGYTAAGDTVLPPPGSPGVAHSSLRPSGKVLIEGTLYQALSAGPFIDQDTPIIVVRHEGTTLFVKPIHSQANP